LLPWVLQNDQGCISNSNSVLIKRLIYGNLSAFSENQIDKVLSHAIPFPNIAGNIMC
jgi:hypothetical protein